MALKWNFHTWPWNPVELLRRRLAMGAKALLSSDSTRVPQVDDQVPPGFYLGSTPHANAVCAGDESGAAAAG